MLPSFLPHNSEAERLLGWKENRKHYWHGNSFDSFLGFISSRIEHQCQYKNPNSTWLSMTHNKALWTELLLRDTRWRQCLKAYTHSMFGQRRISNLSHSFPGPPVLQKAASPPQMYETSNLLFVPCYQAIKKKSLQSHPVTSSQTAVQHPNYRGFPNIQTKVFKKQSH